MTTSHDLLGPRYSWLLSEDDEERLTIDLYAGEWTINYESMGDDCCWHGSTPWVVGVEKAIAYAFAPTPLTTVEDIASAHLDWAQRLGGHKGAGMRRSLKVQLSKRGLALA